MFPKALTITKRIFYALAGFFLILTLVLLVFRKKIERYALAQLDPYFKVPVYIHDVDFTFWRSFPHFSLRLDGVLINDYNEEKGKNTDTLLYAKTINLKTNTWSLLRGELSISSINIEKGRVGLRIDPTGRENFDIFVSDTSSNSDKSFEIDLKKVHFSDLNFSFHNRQTQQEYQAFFDQLKLSGRFSAESFDMQLQSNFKINRFKDKAITLLRKADVKLETQVSVNTMTGEYVIPNTTAEINGIPFELQFSQDSTVFDLKLNASSIPLEMIMESIHQSDLNKLKSMAISGQADMNLHVHGASKINETPNFSAAFKIQNGSMNDQQSQLSLKKLDLEGKYEKQNGQAEVLELNKITVNTMGQNLRGHLSITDFESPRIRASANGEINLKALHHFFPLPQVEHIAGQLAITGNLQAVIRNPGLKNQQIQINNSKSDLDCKKIRMKLKSDFPEFQEINGKVSTRNDDFVFNQFQIQTLTSQLQISGKMDNLLAYLERDEALNLNAAIRADRIDLNEFIKEDTAPEQKPASQTLGAYVLPKNIFGRLEYDIRELIVGKHLFSKLIGVTMLRDREMDFRKIQLEHIGSSIQGDFKVQERSPGILGLQGDVSSKNIDLKKLFAEWNNFEQENIKTENIMGNADAKLKFEMPYHIAKGPMKESLNAQVSLKVVGGALVQMDALREIAQSMKDNDFVRLFLGKNLSIIEQKLENLTFETLENTFYISQSKFVLPKMTIRTNVMDLVVSGWQHFDETLEYRFEFDFKDLKQQTRDAQFGEIRQDGISTRLFLKMYGSLSVLKFAWDSEAKKAHRQEQREQEKQDVKSILKSEFGLFKKDSSVQRFEKTVAPRERIEIDFGDETPSPPDIEKKKREINQKFNKVRKDNQRKDEKVVIEFD